MKKITLSLLALFGTIAMSAQENQRATPPRTHFVSVSTSIPVSNSAKAYPSIEFGHTTNDVSYSLVFGRGDFKNMFSSSKDQLKDYYVEYKITPSTNIGNLSLGFIVGAGSYLGSSTKSNSLHQPFFGEIGGVVSYKISNCYAGVSFTNWDGVNFISPSLSYYY
jgi:hypothetical protein